MSSKKKSEDDEDLADLLEKDQAAGGGSMEMTPLNLDHLTQGKLDVSPRASRSFGRGTSLMDLVSAYCSYYCQFYPKTSLGLALGGMLISMYFLVEAVTNPTERFGVIKYDFTNVHSQYDLTVGKIDHWCLQGGNSGCRCEDPLAPMSRASMKPWVDAHKANRETVLKYANQPLDVAFLGESVVEEMDGRWMGYNKNDDLKKLERLFNNNFDKDKGAKVQGVALGIAGDTSANVLWRLLHGEMADGFNPKVWWISLGMNDLGRMQCSEEVVVLGILRVVEEILTKRPYARVVINSMLPMAEIRGGAIPRATDFQDTFKQPRPRGGSAGRARAEDASHFSQLPTTSETGPSRVPPTSKNPGKTKRTRPDNTRQLREVDLEAEQDYQRYLLEQDLLMEEDYGFLMEDQLEDLEEQIVDEQIAELERKLLEVERDLKKKDRDRDVELEELQKQMEVLKKKKRLGGNKEKKDKFNPVIDSERKKIKKYDPRTAYIKKTKLPLWTSITAINKELRNFAQREDRVTFFDATQIFAARDEGSRYILLSERISVRGHPTVEGYQRWEAAIVTRMQSLLDEIARENPDDFDDDGVYDSEFEFEGEMDDLIYERDDDFAF